MPTSNAPIFLRLLLLLLFGCLFTGETLFGQVVPDQAHLNASQTPVRASEKIIIYSGASVPAGGSFEGELTSPASESTGATLTVSADVTIRAGETVPLTATAAALSDNAVSFDGVNDYIQVGEKLAHKMSGALTIEAWIYPTGPGSHTTAGGVIAGREGEYLVVRFPDGTIRWAFANTSPGWQWFNTGVVAPLNTWSHLAVTYASGVVVTYLNGAAVHTHGTGSGQIGDAVATQNDFRIGGRQNVGQFFQGTIDEVRLWSRKLEATDIQTRYQRVIDVANASEATDLAGYWRLNDPLTSYQAKDATGNASHGVLYNVPSRVRSAVPPFAAGSRTFTWNPADGLSSTTGGSITASPTQTTTYTVSSPRADGTPETAQVTVTVLPALPPLPEVEQNLNYVTVHTILVPGKKTVSDLQGLSVAAMNRQTTYMDGLGRPIQGVVTQGSPDRKDVVQPVIYDQFGRTPTSYMPFTAGDDGTFKTGVVDVTANPTGYANSPQYQFYQNLPGVAADSKPYAQTAFEVSPLSTVTESGGVGSAWNGKTVKPTYRTNAAEENIRVWTYTPNADPEQFGTFSATATYETAALHISEVQDEDNHQVRQYTDKLGQVVLKRAYLSATETLDTYYVYDDFGNLRAVVPPKAVEGLNPASNNWSPNQEFVKTWCFTYCYDHRKRLIEKRAPGAGPVYLVYNKRDEVVLSQDANQENNGQWSFTKYDALGRTLLTGMYASTQTRSALQDAADGAAHLFEERTPNATFQYYTNRAFPVLPATGADLYAALYYDDYDFDNNGTADRAFDTGFDGQFSQAPRPSYLAGTTRIVGTEGLATGSRVRILDKPGSGQTATRWQETVVFYDAEYQPIQTQASHHGGGVDVATTQYDFAGRVVKTFRKHTNPQSVGAAPVEVAARVQYDHMSRPLALHHRVNGQTEEQLSTLSFNELGQVISKRVGRTGLQKMDYAYNIRGWLTRINNAALDTPGDNDLFGMEFFYNEGTTTRFDGNITRIRWKSKLDGVTRQYQYSYDALSRLENATYTHNNATPGERFSLTGIRYDKNGNIEAFTREGLQSRDHNQAPVFGTVDALRYDYEGNQLKTVDDDGAGTGIGGDFVDGYKQTPTTPLREYIFDDNGNLTKDHNKKIENIVYNALNLPEYVYFDGSNQNYIEYLYDGAGSKLRKRLYQGGSLKSTIDYLNGYVYQDDELQFFHTSEGRVLSPKLSGTGAFAYEYHYNDQTGNLRLAFREQGPQQRFTATMENLSGEVALREEAQFSNVSLTRDGDKSCTGQKGAKVNASRALGPWKTIKVGKGDKIYASTRAVYATAATSHGPMLSIYLGNVGSAASGGGEGSQNKTPLLTVGAGFVPDFSQPVGKPKAYLEYIFYDKDEKFVRYEQVPVKARANECDFLELNFTAEQDGYVQVLVANESSTDTWFDDLEITYTPGLIVQEQHYDPWGLNLAGIEKDGDYPFQFNSGSEKQKDASGHGYFYETDFRGYDPQLGRFRGVDALADMWPGITPYQYAYNNPVMFSDPSGLAALPVFTVVGKSLMTMVTSPGAVAATTIGINAAMGSCCGGSGGNGGASINPEYSNPDQVAGAQTAPSDATQVAPPTLYAPKVHQATIRPKVPNAAERVKNAINTNAPLTGASAGVQELQQILLNGIYNLVDNVYITSTSIIEGKPYARHMSGEMVNGPGITDAFMSNLSNIVLTKAIAELANVPSNNLTTFRTGALRISQTLETNAEMKVLRNLRKSIERNGFEYGKLSFDDQIQVFNHNGVDYLVNGHHRFAVAQRLGITNVKGVYISEEYLLKRYGVTPEQLVKISQKANQVGNKIRWY